MEANNWRPAQGGEPSAGVVIDPSAVAWRTQLQPEARQRIVNKIMDTLKRHLPISVPEGLTELKKIAVRFEEKIYTAATSQSDYLRKISLKMLSMETKTQHTTPINPAMSNPVGVNQNPTDPASLGIPSQVSNQGQSLGIPMVNQSSARQPLLTQNLQTNTSASVQGSSSQPPSLPSITALSQSTITGVGQTPTLQNMPGLSQSSVNNSVAQVGSADIYASAQRQLQGRQQQQHQMMSQQQQQQSQNPMFYPQMQQRLLKQNMQHSSLLQPHLQQQQQQSSLPTTQMQSSQQPMMQMPSSFTSSGQSNIQQTQNAAMQSAPQSGLQQNSIQPSVSSLLQQHPQSVSRQQQQAQPSIHQQQPLLQQQANSTQQSTLSQQQQQQPLMGQQGNMTNVQHTQLIGQQNSIADLQQQQQRLPLQQNNLLSMQQSQQMMNQQSISLHQQQQQQLGSQSNTSGQQQQLLGTLPTVQNLQQHQRSMHIMQQSKTAAQQQQNQQQSLTLMQSQSQQSQHPSSQQQHMSQFQSQPSQLQQMGMQQPSNPLQREMQQRLQASGALLQSQNANEQKPFIQQQRGLPEVSSSTSVESTAQTGHAGVVDWQEEVYQKIKSWKELYYTELSEFHQKIAQKLQQHDSLMLSGRQSDQYDKLKNFKNVLERIIHFLQMPKASIQPGMKDKLIQYEKQILGMVTSSRKQKIMSSQPQGQQQFQQPVGGHTHSTQQQPPSQISNLQQHENHANQVQQLSLQGSATSMQSAGVSTMQHGSMPLSTHLGGATQQNITNSLQPGSNLDSVQGTSFNSLQQGAVGSVQQGGAGSLQNTISPPQQTSVNSLGQSAMNALQSNVSPMQSNSNVLQQQQHLKQQQEQQQLMQNQQMKQQIQQRQMQQQLNQQQRQQLLQPQIMQQQLHQQQKQQQASQLTMHQMQQLHPMNELNELKVRQGSGLKPGLYQQHYSAGQHHNYYHQQMKSGASFPISSPQSLQASSPQISHNSSPQIDQHSLLSSLPKAGTPMQSTNSPFVVPSPSTTLAPSPIPGDSEKQLSGISSLTNAGHGGHQQMSLAPSQTQSLAVGTPGISASPLLAEFTSQDGNQASTTSLSKPSVTERPLERLIKVVQSLTPKALSSSVSDIGSVVSMIDRIAGSAPGNGSRAAVGEDLVAMTKCRLQARNFMSQDGGSTAKKMKRNTSAMPLNYVPSSGSVNDSFKQSYGFETSELESTATSRMKRQKAEVNQTLLEEIREINQQLIDTVVNVSDEDADSGAVASESGEGTVVKCSFTAVALSPNLKSQFASAHMSPILPLRLLVPATYPKCSPVLLDKLPVEPIKDFEDLSVKARSRFSVSLRSLTQPMSLGEMARTWDACARKVLVEYAQRTGGGSFSSRYGDWENCVGA